MGRQAAEIVVHGIAATSVVAILLHLPAHRSPRDRERLWLLGVLIPVLLAPLCALASPLRQNDAFRDGYALFSGTHWSVVDVLGVPAGTGVVVVAGLFGAVLFLRDLVPALIDAVHRSHSRKVEVPAAVESAAAHVAQALGKGPPAIEIEDNPSPVVACRGLRRPIVVLSTGLIETLDPDELAAALAHEMSHAFRCDPALGAAVMLLRTLAFFSPGLQLAARALMRETEHRADADAAAAVGDAALVVRSLRKLAHLQGGEVAPFAATWGRLQGRAIERRCAFLLSGAHRTPRLSGPGLLATAAGLALLLFCTVV